MPASVQSFLKSCREHPAKVNETYGEHMMFAVTMSLRLFKAAAAALVHAIIPAFCETTASREIRAMHDEIVARSAPNN